MNKALCVGINNYPGTGNDLSGCVNDANDWKELLESQAFTVTSLLDVDATKGNILNELDNMIQSAESGDVVVFTFSGHGTYVRDLDGDEPDARDEALCPYDLPNLVIDDELYEIFGNRPRGVKPFFFSDSCHSGSVARVMAPVDGMPKVKFMPPEIAVGEDNELMPLSRNIAPRAVKKLLSSGLLISGCADYEYSYDAWFDGRPNGAFTRAAIDTFVAGSSMTKWNKAIRRLLPSSNYPQSPQLFGLKHQKAWKL